MLARCAARLGPGVRWFSAAADVVDEMIAYSRTNYKVSFASIVAHPTDRRHSQSVPLAGQS